MGHDIENTKSTTHVDSIGSTCVSFLNSIHECCTCTCTHVFWIGFVWFPCDYASPNTLFPFIVCPSPHNLRHPHLFSFGVLQCGSYQQFTEQSPTASLEFKVAAFLHNKNMKMCICRLGLCFVLFIEFCLPAKHLTGNPAPHAGLRKIPRRIV